MAILSPPRIILLDWHGTLVDTNDAMYRAMDDMLSKISQLGLESRLVDPSYSKTGDENRLVEHVRTHHRLHPKIVSDRRASRTDLLEILFGRDEHAKDIANKAYNGYYRDHYGDVRPFDPGIRTVLVELRELGIRLGILTNRAREFLDNELQLIDQGSWIQLFECTVSGDDTDSLKPSPAPVYRALQDSGAPPGADVWYVGDSTSDTVAAKTAGITSIFFNGARADREWVDSIFPGNAAHPHLPDHIVNDFQELLGLVKVTMKENEATQAKRRQA